MTRRTERRPYFTAALVLVCWAASLAFWLGEAIASAAAQRWRSLPRSELFHPSFWLYVGWSVVLHRNWSHLILNTVFLAICGAALERSWGHTRFGLMVLVSALFASTAEAVWLGHGDIGVSGVVYACIGALLVGQYLDGEFRTPTLRVAAAALVAWLVAGLIQGGLGSNEIGNVAHLTGLVIGLVYAATSRRRVAVLPG
jgi:membrane associated rhomboid family serine protease